MRREIQAMARHKQILLSTIVLGVLSFATLGVYGLFTSTTQNSGNEISSGTVSFTDNDAGSALYNLTGVRPGDVTTKCIKATYAGSLPAAVRLYSPSTAGPLAQYIDLTITQGTQSAATFPSCTGFTPDATGVIYTGTLQTLEQTKNTYVAGIATTPVGQSAWNTNSALVYRFTTTLQAAAPDTSQGTTSGVHSFIWEARNQ
jgi:hypothetical protein